MDERPPKSASFSIFIHSNFDFQFLFFSSSFLFVLWLSGDFWNANNKLPLQPAMRLHGAVWVKARLPFCHTHSSFPSVRPSVLMHFLRNLRRVSISAQRPLFLSSIDSASRFIINQPNSQIMPPFITAISLAASPQSVSQSACISRISFPSFPISDSASDLHKMWPTATRFSLSLSFSLLLFHSQFSIDLQAERETIENA